MAEDNDWKVAELEKKIQKSQSCLQKCSSKPLSGVEGVKKLIKKLEAELSFLQRIQQNKNGILDAHIGSSNLVHLSAVVHATSLLPGVEAILRPYRYTHSNSSTIPNNCLNSTDNTRKLVVDVVIDNGMLWVKVIGRNPDSMDFLSTGQGHFGEKSIVEHAEVYLNCAQQNIIYFTVPRILFLFYNGINEELKDELVSQGIIVKCPQDIFNQDSSESSDTVQSTELFTTLSDKVTMLNLDVSTMMAYVSSLTNGGTKFEFRERILTEHVEMELKNPIKVFLDKLFNGKQLVACETAVRDLRGILDKVGGEGEKQRTEIFLQRVKIIADAGYGSYSALKLKGKIRERSMLVFGCGEAVQAVTVTANAGFVRSARSQHINLPAIVHESRMLTEQKEKTATSIVK